LENRDEIVGNVRFDNVVVFLIGRVQNFSTWIMFFLNIVVVGVIGYIVSFFGVLKKTERQEVSQLIERMFKGIKRN
jgi:predicted membrane protein